MGAEAAAQGSSCLTSLPRSSGSHNEVDSAKWVSGVDTAPNLNESTEEAESPQENRGGTQPARREPTRQSLW